MPSTDEKLRELHERQQNLKRLGRQAQKLSGGAYARHRDDAARRSREKSEAGREIGPLPAVVNPARRAACKASLQLHIETYLKREDKFDLPWCDDHLKVIARLEYAILHGDLYALAMFRGGGKTSLCEAAAQWGTMHAHRYFGVLLGATADAATEMLDSIKMEIETNDLYLEDFPEICYPVRCLDGNNNRAMGQKLNGRRTRIVWKDSKIVFPTVAGSSASGSRIYVAGITGRVRGMKATTADGKSIRPDFAIADDPQTDESSGSTIMTDKRERTLRGAVKGLAGPGKTIAMVVPCTVIARDDLSYRLLDRKRNPQFKGERFQLVIAFPKNEPLWEEYGRLRRESLETGGNGEEATEFYRRNRESMDDGATIAWSERFDRRSELSAIQAAMNLKIDNPWEFAAEYQNDPLDEHSGAVSKILYADELVKRINRIPRLVVPREATRLTAFIDVGGEILWYVITAWDERFGGGVIDYGFWPPQSRQTFSGCDPNPSLSMRYAGLSEEQRIYAGLSDLTKLILGRTYLRHETGESTSIVRCLIDHGYKDNVVYQFCRESPFKSILVPSQGHAAKASNPTPMSRWRKRDGEIQSKPNQPSWRLGPVGSGKGRHVLFDKDEWMTFIAERLLTRPGGPGCLRLFGDQESTHQLFAEHCTCEMAAPVTMGGRTFDKWGKRVGRDDNHLWDAVVGSGVAVAVAGLEWSSSMSAPEVKPPRKKLTYAEQRAKLDARDRERAQQR